MKQNNIKRAAMLLGKSSKLSRTMTLLTGVVFLSLQLLTGKAYAQIATYTGSGGTSTTITYYANESGTTLQKTGFGTNTPCGSGGLSGMTVSSTVATYGTSNPRVYFTVTPDAGYQLNVTSFSAGLRRSGTGPTKVRYAYSLDGGTTWVNDGTDHSPLNGSCGGSTTTGWGTLGGSLPTSVTGSVIFALYPFAPSASTGTFQVNTITIGGTITATSCSGTPSAGSASATPSSICGSGASALSLVGGTGGTGITYQWQDSPDGSTWSNISGATNNTYATGTLTSTTYYRVITTCTTSGLSATSSSATVTINSVPTVDPISGASTVIIGTPETLSTTTTGGAWSSACTSIASVGGTTGVVTGNAPGVTTVTYSKTAGGCTGIATKSVTVLEANTIAVYTGACGNGLGTSVIVNSANASVGSLTAVGFGSATACGSGGLSGLTVSTVYATYSAAGPHVYYQITPASGYQLSITDIKAITRESGTGPQTASIAYSLDGGSTWVNDGDHVQGTGGSCGANSNVFSYTGGVTLVATTNVLVAVYPYNPTASGGTFQLNRLTVFGSVNPLGTCSGTPTAGTASVSGASLVCGSGAKTISLTGASTDLGITYQWQDSPDGSSWTDISGATNTSYNTPTLTSTTYYRNVVTCTISSTSSNSASTVVSVNPIPSAGTITGNPAYIYIGTPVTLSNAVTGGTWSSDHAAIAAVGSADGEVSGVIPGTSVIKYTVTVDGCSGFTTEVVNILHPNTIAAYLGTGGTSVSTIAFAGVSTTTLTATGTSTITPCGSGGLSGLTVSTTVATYSSSNPSVSFKVTANPGYYMDVTGFHVTLRRSTSGIRKVRMAYSLDNGATWNDDGVDQAPDNAGCSNSSTDFSYATTLPTGISASGDGVIFAFYPFDPIAAGGTIQINSVDILGFAGECPVAAEIEGADEVCVGSVITLTNATEDGAWSSSNTEVATVVEEGVDVGTTTVTGVSAGVVTITYTVDGGSVCATTSATKNITVNPVPSVDAIGGTLEVCVGETTSLTNDTEEGVWSSSNTGVATIGVSGVATGVAAGTSTISYTVTNEFGCSASATAELTVNPLPSVDAITGVEPICVDGNIELANTTAGGSWSSSNTAVATVDPLTGIVTGVAEGTAVITYTVTNEFGCSAFVTAEVEVIICGGKSAGTTAVAVVRTTNVKLYPNPATSVLNVVAAERVNVTVLSVDGKVLIEQKDAVNINVSNLASGVYIVKIYNSENALIETARFTKN